jgi:hypothetical protein
MKVLDLFSGIGGFSLGLERSGHETVAFCEIEPFCQKVLKQWWPSTPIFKDIVKLNDYLEKALTALPADSPARTSALPVKKLGYSLTAAPSLPKPVLDSLGRHYEPFAWYALEDGSWRTWQQSMTDSWGLYSDRWPKAGMMLNGIAYRRGGSAGGICEKDSTPWPTPTASDYKGASSGCRKIAQKEISILRYFLHYHFAKPHQKTTYPNPTLLEKLMGYPIGHTVLKDSETP